MSLNLYPTDWGFFAILAFVIIYGCRSLFQSDVRERWRRVFQTPSAGGAAVVIVFYLSVAILDSLRLGSDAGTLTALDVLLTPLRTHVERTYSAPFASQSFVKETRIDDMGKAVREYPALAFGARHLANPEERVNDVIRHAGRGIAAGLACWGLIVGLIAYRVRAGAGLVALWRLPHWRAPLVIAGALCAALGACAYLAPHYHVFGTDQVGVDVLYRVLKSVRTGLVLGTLTILISLPVALVLGLLAGYFGGWIDDVVQYLYTTLASIPGVLLIAAAALTLELYLQAHVGDAMPVAERADLRLFGICVVLGLTGWTTLCRLLRAEVMKLRTLEFVIAARALGGGTVGILWRHLLPNTMHIVIITSVINFSGMVLAEAVLTYIDIGVDPSMESWGNMINSARLELAREPAVWWSLSAAFVFMFGLVLSANLFADAVRDAFDPYLRRT
jgi:peptide/nickel transport system permease protein